MPKRLKKALVESYVGAIAIGWTIADSATELANALGTPITTAIRQHMVQQIVGVTPTREPIDWKLSLPGIMSAIILLAVAYGLLRWLYYPSPQEESEVPASDTAADSADSAAL